MRTEPKPWPSETSRGTYPPELVHPVRDLKIRFSSRMAKVSAPVAVPRRSKRLTPSAATPATLRPPEASRFGSITNPVGELVAEVDVTRSTTVLPPAEGGGAKPPGPPRPNLNTALKSVPYSASGGGARLNRCCWARCSQLTDRFPQRPHDRLLPLARSAGRSVVGGARSIRLMQGRCPAQRTSEALHSGRLI